MKRILITGGDGLLGQSLTKYLLRETNYELVVTGLRQTPRLTGIPFEYVTLDVTSRDDVKETILKYRPDVVINTAALTDVDRCEMERENAHLVNVMAVEYLAEAARIAGIQIIHISTDYLFDGENPPYTEESMPNPINYYGKTKLASENLLHGSGIKYTIIRTALLFGVGIETKQNFVTWVLNNLSIGKHISVVTDQIGQPTFVDDLTYAITKVVEKEQTGVFHVCGSESVSRYSFAAAIADVFNLENQLIKSITTKELGQRAVRPKHTEFITQKSLMMLGVRTLDVHDGLMTMKMQMNRSSRWVR